MFSLCGYNSAATVKYLAFETFVNIEGEARKLPITIDRFIQERKIKISNAEKLRLFEVILGPNFSVSNAALEFRAGDRSLIKEIILLVQQILKDKGYNGIDSIGNIRTDSNVIKTKIGELFCNSGKLPFAIKKLGISFVFCQC